MKIRKFKKEDQEVAKNIILRGLREYFDVIDHTLNPDVYNIHYVYVRPGRTFLVAEIEGKVIGTGGLKETDDPAMVQMVRVSVHPDYRRKGIAKEIVKKLMQKAKRMKYKKILVETTKTWVAPRTLYNSIGFSEAYEDEEDVYMIVNLS